jgi:hypothetical protein
LTAYRCLHDLRFPFYINIIGDSSRKPLMASVLMHGMHLEYNIFNPVVSQIVLLNFLLTDVTQRMSYTEKSKVVISECLHRVSSSSGFPLKTCGNDSPFCFLRNISY